jgi:hypothetical protein
MFSFNNKYIFYAINLIGGTAVLLSYAYGLTKHVDLRMYLWGEIPVFIRPYYTINMILAAVGYFFFTSYLLKHLIFIDNGKGNNYIKIINILYAGFIIPSAIWMPMTFSVLTSHSDLLWLSIRIVLFIVGFSTSGILAFFLFSNIRKYDWHYFAGILGLISIWIQTMILDALVWPYYFLINPG